MSYLDKIFDLVNKTTFDIVKHHPIEPVPIIVKLFNFKSILVKPCSWVKGCQKLFALISSLKWTLNLHTPPEWATCQKLCPEKWYTTYCKGPLGVPKNAFGQI